MSVKSSLWSGRFTAPIADVAHRFSSSIHVDGKLYTEDILGSIAHARMLGAQGIIALDEAAAIVDGLLAIRSEIDSGALQFDPTMEDVHMAIETRLIETIGAVGGKLHTGRSRNDQVATDTRLYIRRAIGELTQQIHSVMQALLAQAEVNIDAVMPGYTHMQRAQPVLLSHHLLAYVEMLDRDRTRLEDCLRRSNYSPLGAAAFAGTPYPLDRNMTALDLGFDGVIANSIDAVSDRDHFIELASACSIIMMHLSRLAEELVIWSTKEFSFVTMSDAVTTGSSIMPQKKNPDMAELVRGKVGRVYGSLITLLTIMKALPLAYNRDMQEDKEPLFDAVNTTRDSLEIMSLVIRETTFHSAVMGAAVRGDLSLATEIADYLTTKGVPFRDAHHITGKIVAFAVDRGLTLSEIPLASYQSYSPEFSSDIFDYLDPRASVNRKKSIGSTNSDMVRKAIQNWREKLS